MTYTGCIKSTDTLLCNRFEWSLRDTFVVVVLEDTSIACVISPFFFLMLLIQTRNFYSDLEFILSPHSWQVIFDSQAQESLWDQQHFKDHFVFHNDKSVRERAYVYRFLFSFLVRCPLAIKTGLTKSRECTLIDLT